jgi:hypothetical protein
MDYSAIPESCRSEPKDPRIPQFLIDYKAGKAKEMFDVIQTLFKNRGATKACGYCSRKVQCRAREEEGEEGGHGGRKRHHMGCQHKEFKMVDEECEGHEACVLTPVLGGCPAPVPQKHMLEHAKHMHGLHQHGQFHHYQHHWGGHHGHHGHRSGEHSGSHSGSRESGEWHHRGPRAISSDEDSSSNETSSSSHSKEHSGEASKSVSHESGGMSHESGGMSHESGEHYGNHRNHTGLPLWHCLKNKDGSKCLCCCGNYFPDIASGTCMKFKFGDKMHLFDLWDMTSGGMPTGDHK